MTSRHEKKRELHPVIIPPEAPTASRKIHLFNQGRSPDATKKRPRNKQNFRFLKTHHSVTQVRHDYPNDPTFEGIIEPSDVPATDTKRHKNKLKQLPTPTSKTQKYSQQSRSPPTLHTNIQKHFKVIRICLV